MSVVWRVDTRKAKKPQSNERSLRRFLFRYTVGDDPSFTAGGGSDFQ